MFNKIRNFFSKPRISYQPLIEIRVFKNSLLHNLREYQRNYPNVEIAPVLKSNAYGHGLVTIAEILDDQNLPFFMVDSFYEALTLRQAGIRTKILILGFLTDDQLQNDLPNCSLGINSLEVLRKISQNLKFPKKFHLKIDTGMHRQGILMEEIEEAIRLIKNNPNVILEGLCTHFADAENTNSEFTLGQIAKWNAAAKIFKPSFPDIKYFHAANTAGFAFSSQIDANVGRLGIGLYGLDTAPKSVLSLRPALEMRSLVSLIKLIGPHEKVGYDLDFETTRPTKIACVPAGYYEGIDRRLSNQGVFLIQAAECPIIGRVSMNMTAIDVSVVPEVKLEQPVVIFSANPADKNSVENVSKICNCLQREILVHIPQSLRRTIV